MFQVLIAIDEHLIVHLQLVDQVFYEVEVIGVEWRKLDRLKVFPGSLRLDLCGVDKFLCLLHRPLVQYLLCLALSLSFLH